MMQKINRVQSFQYAFAGIWHTLRTQRNAQIHLTVGLAICGVGILLRLSLTEWAIIILTIGFVVAMEMFNTAAESIMDYLTVDFHPQVKIIKDVAAGAVLMSALTSVMVGVLILGPPLLEQALLLLAP